MTNPEDTEAVTSAEPEAAGGVYLARQYAVNGMSHMETIRALSAEEHSNLGAASKLVRAIARQTPYHSLIAARDRFQESFQQFAGQSTEAPDVRRQRADAALNTLLAKVASHADDWSGFIAEHQGDAASFEGTASTWAAHPAAAFAKAALAAKTRTLSVAPDGQPLYQADEATVALAGWVSHVEVQAVFAADAALNGMWDRFKAAAAVILGLASEVFSGAPFLMPGPNFGDKSFKMDMGTLDVETVRSADAFLLSARSMAIDLRKAPAPQPMEWPSASSTDDTTPAKGTGEGAEPSAPLPEIHASLRQVSKAIAENVAGLASKWARLFDDVEFIAAVETEKALAASLVQPLVRSLQKEEHEALAAGEPARTMPAYPVPLGELGAWLTEHASDVPAVALITTLPAYLQSLEEVTYAAAMSYGHGNDFIEFDPFRTTTLHRQAKLLAELADESAEADESDRLRTAIYLCNRLGLPEAQLLYATRQLARTAPELADALEPVREHIAKLADGQPTSLATQVLMAETLTREIDQRGHPHG